MPSARPCQDAPERVGMRVADEEHDRDWHRPRTNKTRVAYLTHTTPSARRAVRLQSWSRERSAPCQQIVGRDRVDDRARIPSPLDQTRHEQHLKVSGYRGWLRGQSRGDPADLLRPTGEHLQNPDAGRIAQRARSPDDQAELLIRERLHARVCVWTHMRLPQPCRSCRGAGVDPALLLTVSTPMVMARSKQGEHHERTGPSRGFPS
jgi:hypothetical protein